MPCHVDSAIGGYILPWVEKLGHDIPKFDFRCRGVSSINADVHKFGYAPKGSSVLVFRKPEVRNY
jgi:sphinganine-1-phosphate aldolase